MPILIVMHINPLFAAAFAEWLDAQTSHRAAFARDGEPVEGAAGRIVLAPPDWHMIVQNGRTRLTYDPERHSCRPSVDVLFELVAREYGRRRARRRFSLAWAATARPACWRSGRPAAFTIAQRRGDLRRLRHAA